MAMGKGLRIKGFGDEKQSKAPKKGSKKMRSAKAMTKK